MAPANEGGLPHSRGGTQRPSSWHRLGPGDVPLEAQRCRHRAVAIPIVAVGGIVAVSPVSSARSRSSMISQRMKPSPIGAAASRSTAASTSCRSASVPRASSVCTRTSVAGAHHGACPRLNKSSMAARISGRAPSRSPRLALSRAMYTSMSGDSSREYRCWRLMSRTWCSSCDPRSQSGSPRCTSASPSAVRALPSVSSSLVRSAICSASSISCSAVSSATRTPAVIRGAYL